MLTTVFGNVMRDAAGGGKAWISSPYQARGFGRDHRHSARAQGRALRPLALRRHHHHAAGCAGAERDRDHLRLCEPRAAQPSGRRACRERHQGRRRAGLIARISDRTDEAEPNMSACKTGAEHIKSLKDGRTVYIDGKLRAGRHRASGVPQFGALGGFALRLPGAAGEPRTDDVQAGRREPPRQPRLADAAQPRRDGPAPEGAAGLGRTVLRLHGPLAGPSRLGAGRPAHRHRRVPEARREARQGASPTTSRRRAATTISSPTSSSIRRPSAARTGASRPPTWSPRSSTRIRRASPSAAPRCSAPARSWRTRCSSPTCSR